MAVQNVGILSHHFMVSLPPRPELELDIYIPVSIYEYCFSNMIIMQNYNPFNCRGQVLPKNIPVVPHKEFHIIFNSQAHDFIVFKEHPKQYASFN
jgi:hypothetical protein